MYSTRDVSCKGKIQNNNDNVDDDYDEIDNDKDNNLAISVLLNSPAAGDRIHQCQ